MKKICFVTGTRADYGILAPVMSLVAKSPEARLQVIATNMHLSNKFGQTISEIEADGFKVDIKIDSLIEEDSPQATVISMARVEDGLANAFSSLMPDIVVILGDRYEALAAASAAVVFNIPVAHLHGGETTEGAIDDKFRNAITQLSTWHFAATPRYAEKIISMGIPADHVFHSGAPGAEVIELENEQQIAQDLYDKTGINPYEPYIILAMHPVTTLPDKGIKELTETLSAIAPFTAKGYKVLATMPNSDPGHSEFFETIKNWAGGHKDNVKCVTSLGARLFHFAMDNAAAIIGNSSAALIEAPSHRLAAINVGLRQKGRAHGITVLDVPASADRIKRALDAALSLEMKSVAMGMSVEALNPYYKENSSQFIANKLLEL